MRESVSIIAPGWHNAMRLGENGYITGWPDDPTGYDTMVEVGAKLRVNFRTANFDDEQCKARGIEVLRFPMSYISPPSVAAVTDLCKMLKAGKGKWVGGCQGAQDRSGFFRVVWRMVIDGWTKAEALEEMNMHILNKPFGGWEVWWGIRERIEEL